MQIFARFAKGMATIHVYVVTDVTNFFIISVWKFTQNGQRKTSFTVAIEEPSGKRSLVKNVIAQQTSLHEAIMEPYL